MLHSVCFCNPNDTVYRQNKSSESTTPFIRFPGHACQKFTGKPTAVFTYSFSDRQFTGSFSETICRKIIKKPKIIGHRGAAGLVFENTLASMEKAIELGVAAIETDVWQTTDGEIVVFHDAYLDRLTPETGLIAEKSYAELQANRLNNGDRIPTLQEVVELVKARNMPLIAEVKAEIAFENTLKILEADLDYADFVIGSFYHQRIMELKQEKPQLQTAIMLECVPANLEDYLQTVNPDYVVAALETHNRHLLETVANQGRKLLFYTVNTPPEISLAIKANPYGIITNFPDRLLASVR